MKRLMQLGFAAGFAAMLAAGYFLPWIAYERYPSQTNAVVNGGRSETFLIRLPSDLIFAVGNAQPPGEASLVAAAFPAAFDLPEAAESQVEHYKLRDVDGNVIGIAARHSTESPVGSRAAWVLTIPSRGSVVFAGADSRANVIDEALTARGWRPGQAFAATTTVARLNQFASVQTAGEFSGLDFRLTETWEVTGVDAENELRGTISLATTGERR